MLVLFLFLITCRYAYAVASALHDVGNILYKDFMIQVHISFLGPKNENGDCAETIGTKVQLGIFLLMLNELTFSLVSRKTLQNNF